MAALRPPRELAETIIRENKGRIRPGDVYAINAPSSPGTATFSFVGVKFADPQVASVRIITGNEVIGKTAPRRDVVVMDDFVYAEPQPAQ